MASAWDLSEYLGLEVTMRFMTGPILMPNCMYMPSALISRRQTALLRMPTNLAHARTAIIRAAHFFTTAWNEINDDNKSDGGKVKIDNERLKLEDANHGAWRAFDLTQATSASVSYVSARRF